MHVMHDTHPTRIGDDVTIGHGAIVHGCTIGERVLIGMGAIVLNGATVGEDSIVAAGTLVTEGMVDSAAVARDGQSRQGAPRAVGRRGRVDSGVLGELRARLTT